MAIYHCCFDLDHLVHRGGAAEMAKGGVKFAGCSEWATEADILTRATLLKMRGFEVMPTCHHYNDLGYCLGHPEKEPTR